MSGVNKVILVRHLGKDTDVRHLENGVAVASFSLATTETYTNKAGEKSEQTEWHNIVLWRGLAEVAEKYLKKGKQIYGLNSVVDSLVFHAGTIADGPSVLTSGGRVLAVTSYGKNIEVDL